MALDLVPIDAPPKKRGALDLVPVAASPSPAPTPAPQAAPSPSPAAAAAPPPAALPPGKPKPQGPLERALETFRVPGALAGAVARDAQEGGRRTPLTDAERTRLVAAIRNASTDEERVRAVQAFMGRQHGGFDPARDAAPTTNVAKLAKGLQSGNSTPALDEYYLTGNPTLTALRAGHPGFAQKAAATALEHPYATGFATFGGELFNPENIATGEIGGALLRAARGGVPFIPKVGPAIDAGLTKVENAVGGAVNKVTQPVRDAVGSLFNRFHGVAKATGGAGTEGESAMRAAVHAAEVRSREKAQDAMEYVFGQHLDKPTVRTTQVPHQAAPPTAGDVVPWGSGPPRRVQSSTTATINGNAKTLIKFHGDPQQYEWNPTGATGTSTVTQTVKPRGPIARALGNATGGLTHEQSLEIFRRAERDVDGNMVNVPRNVPEPKTGPTLQERADHFYEKIIVPITARRVASGVLAKEDVLPGYLPKKEYSEDYPVYESRDAANQADDSVKVSWPRSSGFGKLGKTGHREFQGSLDDLEAQGIKLSPKFNPAFQLYNYVQRAEHDIAVADAIRGLENVGTAIGPARVTLGMHFPNDPTLPFQKPGEAPNETMSRATAFANRNARAALVQRAAQQVGRSDLAGGFRGLASTTATGARYREAARAARAAAKPVAGIQQAGTDAVGAADPTAAIDRLKQGLGVADAQRADALGRVHGVIDSQADERAAILANQGRPTSPAVNRILRDAVRGSRPDTTFHPSTVAALRKEMEIAAGGKRVTNADAQTALKEALADYQGRLAKVRDPEAALSEFRADLEKQRGNDAQGSRRAGQIVPPTKPLTNALGGLETAGTAPQARAVARLGTDLDRNQEGVLRAAVRGQGYAERAAVKADKTAQLRRAAWQQARTDAAARQKIEQIVAREHTAAAQRMLESMIDKPPKGYTLETRAALGYGNDLSAAKALHNDFFRFFTEGRAAGGLPEDARGAAKFFALLNSFARRSMVIVPTVHVIPNMGFAFLAEGGRPEEMAQALAGRYDKNWLPPDLEERFQASGAASTPQFGSTADRVRNATTPLSELDPRKATGTGLERVKNAVSLASGAVNKVAEHTILGPDAHYVFDTVENGYARVLFKRFVEEQGLTDGQAARRIRKTLGDTASLTGSLLERIARGVFFFYPWMKTAIPFWTRELFRHPGQAYNAPMQGIRANNEVQGDTDNGQTPRSPWSLTLGHEANGDFRRMALPLPQKYGNDVAGVLLGNGDQRADVVQQHMAPIANLVRGHENPLTSAIHKAVFPGQAPYEKLAVDKNSDVPALLQIGGQILGGFTPPTSTLDAAKDDPIGAFLGEAGLGYPTSHLSTMERQRQTLIKREYGAAIKAWRDQGREDKAKELYLQMQAQLQQRPFATQR